jgi:hypothetical protein
MPFDRLRAKSGGVIMFLMFVNFQNAEIKKRVSMENLRGRPLCDDGRDGCSIRREDMCDERPSRGF